MFVTLYKVGKVYFRFLCMNSFHVIAKNERFTAAGLCMLSSEPQISNLTLSFGRLCQKIAPKSLPYKQQEYFSSFKQSNHWFVALLVPLRSLFLKLSNKRDPTVLRNPSGSQGNQLVIYKPDEVDSAGATGKKSNISIHCPLGPAASVLKKSSWELITFKYLFLSYCKICCFFAMTFML